MMRTKQLVAASLPFLIALSLICCLVTVLFLNNVATTPSLGYAILVDFTITIPLVYFLLIRKTKIINFSAITLSVIGLFLADWLLPEYFAPVTGSLKQFVFPVLETTILAIVLYKIYRFKKTLSNTSNGYVDAIQLLRTNFKEVIANKVVADVFVTELSVLYYTFLSWIPKKPEKAFTIHKNSGNTSLFAALIVVIAAETVGFHFLLEKWSTTVAWIFTISSIYVGLQLFAHVKALIQRPVSIEGDMLIIRYGIFMETSIPFHKIKAIEKNTSTPVKEKGTEKIGLLGETESHNLLLTLHKNETLIKPYGVRKLFKKLYFYVDEPTNLIGTINKLCLKKSPE